MAERPRRARPIIKPTTYKVLCISTYIADLERMDGLVAEMKSRGYTKASRSMLIRMAITNLDLDKALAAAGPPQ